MSRVSLMPIDSIPCATNPICEHGNLIEENKRLKATIDKGLATCIQGKKNLDDLLSNQRDNVSKEGIGFSQEKEQQEEEQEEEYCDIFPAQHDYLCEGGREVTSQFEPCSGRSLQYYSTGVSGYQAGVSGS